MEQEFLTSIFRKTWHREAGWFVS